MRLPYPGGMTNRSSLHGVFDRYMRDLNLCPPLTPAEERTLALRMLRLRTRLSILLRQRQDAERPAAPDGAPGGADVPFPPSADELPFAQLEARVDSLMRAAADCRDARLQAAARRARALFAALDLARSTFVRRNLRLTFHFARRVAGRATPLADLVQAGNVGLLEAVDRFDPRRGTRFSTYAVMYITRSVFRTMPRMSQAVHVPEYQRRLKSRLGQSRRSLAQEMGRAPTLAETAARAHVQEEQARKALETRLTILELDAPVPGAEKGTLGDTLVGDDALSVQRRLIADDLQRLLHHMLPRLDARSREVLRLRYGLGGTRPHTLMECGTALDLSRERIRQIEAAAIALLRDRARRLAASAAAPRRAMPA